MKEVIKDVLDFKVPTLIFETVDEAVVNAGGDDRAKGESLVLARLNDYLVFHGTNDEARDLVTAVLEEQTKIKRKTWKEKDGDKEVEKYEKDSLYVPRALVEMDGTITKEALQEIINERARGYTRTKEDGTTEEVEAIAVSLKPTVRKSGPKKLAEAYKTAASNVIAKGEDNVAAFIKDLYNKHGISVERSDDSETMVKNLGWGIKELQDKRFAAERAEQRKREEEALKSLVP